MGYRITRNRPLTAEEKLKYAEIRQQIAEELPQIKLRAQSAKPRILLRHIANTLKQERERRGLSLDDMAEKSGIDREVLRTMEADLKLDVTMYNLLQYAEAIGKTLTVQVQDCATSRGS